MIQTIWNKSLPPPIGGGFRSGTIAAMLTGPNGRQNRYLKNQYKRLFASIGGTVKYKNRLDSETKAVIHSCWVDWKFKLKDIDRKDRKVWKRNSKKFWDIAFNLLLNSITYRTVLMTSVLGKAKRWYHRDISIAKLLIYNYSYCKIVKNLNYKLPIQRKWIPSGNKYRPIGIVPIAWRIYTKGISQMLGTFLQNSWPDNQHGYTKGRGVQTAWRVILNKIIKKEFIFEYDLVGYFNNISHRCVVRQLDRFQVPKYVIMLLVELNCGETQAPLNSDVMEMMGFDENEQPDLPGVNFEDDWKKHEYLHKYRDGWRNRGFPRIPPHGGGWWVEVYLLLFRYYL